MLLHPKPKALTPFALWRSPQVSSAHILIHSEFGSEQFRFAPFDGASHEEIILSGQSQPFQEGLVPNSIEFSSGLSKPSSTSKEEHIAMVQSAVRHMKSGKLDKVVLSRVEKHPQTLPAIDVLFNTLSTAYPDAFCYVFYHPDCGLWAGASPEILLDCEKGFCTTMSLAGTRDKRAPRAADWSAKEYEEQEIVTQFLVDQLKTKGVFLGPIGPPKTLQSGHLEHLMTKLRFEWPTDPYSLLKLLHPTPAVCGWPAPGAKDYILANEGYDRGFYTGYLAHLKPNNSTTAYVNLRCMHWIENEVFVYAGGGITARSDAESEYHETEAKMAAMLGVIEKL